MFPILADFLATLRGGLKAQGVACPYARAVGLLTVRPGRYGKDRRGGQARKTGRGVPVRESCRAPYSAPRPVRVGEKSGPAEGLQGRSVRGRQLHYGHMYITTQPADHINRQLVKQQRRYLFKA